MKTHQATTVLALGALVALTTALPQPTGVEKVGTSGYPDQPPSIDLPFLQFKNGGIRVNFAGYHAEAGLGGLLGGSDAKGGLFASAGTPWGPSASAGLGGSLGGADGRASGGLHARAGLGNGGPEAAAGLGGSLDGSGRSGSRARGGLFAGATAGGPGAAAGLGGEIGSDGKRTGSSYAASTDGLNTKFAVKDVSNIQAIAPPPNSDKVYLAKSGIEEPQTTLEFKRPTANARAAVAAGLVARDVPNPGPKYDVVGPNAVLPVSDVQTVDEFVYPVRRYHRKRLRGNTVRKPAFYKFLTVNAGPADDAPIESASQHVGKTVERQTTVDRQYGYDVPQAVPTKTRGTTLFDDIFNIPISTLAAVNQLLNNKAG